MGKPFHVFKDPKGFYLYDLAINGVKKITNETYNMLSEIENSDLNIDYTSIPIRELQNAGFLIPNKVTDIKHYAIDYIEELLERKLSNLVLQITQDCNLKCSYCSFSNNDGNYRLHSNKVMDLETAKSSVDFLKKNSVDTMNVSISFYGGEPLLEFKKITEIVKYANQIFSGKLVVYSITTNATLLTEESLKFIEDNNFNLTISIDGDKYINDKKRRFRIGDKSVFDKVKVIIEKIAIKYPVLFSKLAINMVMDPSENFTNYYQIIQDIPELSEVRITTNICADEHSTIKNEYSPSFFSKYEYYDFISLLKYFNRYSVSVKDNIFDNDVSTEVFTINNNMHKRTITSVAYPGGPCIPGFRKLFITVNGDMFPCEKINEKSEINKIGSIEDGFDYVSVRRLLQLAEITDKECKQCWAFTLCTSCLLHCDGKNALSKDERLANCQSMKRTAEYNIRKSVMYDNVISETSSLPFMEECVICHI